MLDGRRVAAVGHRVVHGGPDFAAPVLVDVGVMERLRELAPLAPLHQPHNLAGIKAVADQLPGVPQVACFVGAVLLAIAFIDEWLRVLRGEDPSYRAPEDAIALGKEG
jgi:acetate kinase